MFYTTTIRAKENVHRRGKACGKWKWGRWFYRALKHFLKYIYNIWKRGTKNAWTETSLSSKSTSWESHLPVIKDDIGDRVHSVNVYGAPWHGRTLKTEILSSQPSKEWTYEKNLLNATVGNSSIEISSGHSFLERSGGFWRGESADER